MKSSKGYKQALVKAAEMRGQSGCAAYDRGKVLCDVFSDRDFRADTGVIDDHAAAAILDDYVQDLCVSFLELRAMIQFAPDRARWQNGKLRELHDEMMEAHRASRESSRTTEQKRRSVTVKEFEALEQSKKSEEARASFLSKEVESTRSTVERLQSENRELREQLAEARGRIKELERIAGRELQAA